MDWLRFAKLLVNLFPIDPTSTLACPAQNNIVKNFLLLSENVFTTGELCNNSMFNVNEI